MVVDWEYGADNFWHNDLAFIGSYRSLKEIRSDIAAITLNPEQNCVLANAYYEEYMQGARRVMPPSQMFEFRCYRFMHNTLQLLWSTRPDNIDAFEIQNMVCLLVAELEDITPGLVERAARFTQEQNRLIEGQANRNIARTEYYSNRERGRSSQIFSLFTTSINEKN